jgi:beta-carotene hydroxylase
MSNSTLDHQAIKAATAYMGGVAWLTVGLALACFAGFLAVVYGAVTGALPLWLGALLFAVLVYAAYTPMHDAVHGSIAGKRRGLVWLQKLIGYLMGFMLIIPFTAHRYEHLAHHRHTNDPERDPDSQISDMGRSPLHALLAAYRLLVGQVLFYCRQRWGVAPWSEKAVLILELCVALGLRVAVFASGYWLEGVMLFVVGYSLGACLLAYLFAYIVHRPHDQVGRYVDTSTIQLARWGNGLLTWCWLFQNYHSIHHLFPKVAFYQYRNLFEDIEPIMRAKGAPMYVLSPLGLKAQLAT